MKFLDWKYALSLLVGAASVLGPILLWRYDINARSLTISIVSRTSLQTELADHDKALQIMVDGKELRSVYSTVIEVANDGSKPIPLMDFESAVELKLSSKGSIVRAIVSSTTPKNLNPIIDLEEGALRIQPLLLNPEDSIRISMISTGEAPVFEPRARIVGLRDVSIVENPKGRFVETLRWLLLVPAFMLSVVAFVTVDGTSKRGVQIWRRAAYFITAASMLGASMCVIAFQELAGATGISGVMLVFAAVATPAVIFALWLNRTPRPPSEESRDAP